MTDKDARCRCGHKRSDTMLPGREQDFDAEPLVCHACAALDRAAAAWRNAKGEPHGVYFMLRELD